MTSTKPAATDPALWTVRPVFGVAGGPNVVVLTDEGNARAFARGAQVRRGPASAALEALHTAGGRAELVTYVGTKCKLTPLGRQYDQVVWGYLRSLGYVDGLDTVCLTDAGRAAVKAGNDERTYLLQRCTDAAGLARG